jgi:putative tryptophan/tyrosine transport system permease protein
MELWVGALNLGFLYAFMTMGVFITFRIHDFPDITVDGSFTSGAAAAAVLLTAGVNPAAALAAAFLIGAVAGCVTALINTRFKVNGLLAGILVMTALYSINLHIMGRSNIPLLNQKTLFSWLTALNPGLHPEVWTALAIAVLMAGFWFLMSLFFKTDFGIAMRVTGNNPTMASANGVNVNRMTIFGVALANGLVGISGALVAQYQGFADIGMGIGTVVIGLAAVIVGESVLRLNSMFARVLSVIIGSIIFRLMIAVALYVGMNPIDLKLLTAVFVLLTLVVSKSVGGGKSPSKLLKTIPGYCSSRKLRQGALAAIAIALILFFGYRFFSSSSPTPTKVLKIGCVQLTDNGLLNITRDSLVDELARLGYRNHENCTLMLENAHGDLPTVNTIIDKFIQQNVDIIVTISTGCTQAAINKVKDRPIVFATVANPFLIMAGTSDADHLPNVTGVYGWVPMDKMLAIARKTLPGPISIGTLWDPSQPNSVFNVELLKKAAQAYQDVTFEGTTITNSSEVYQAAVSLAHKDINAFVLCPDNIVYSAFDAVVKAAREKNIPIFMSDVERLKDGALAVLGYDYTSSGIQAAHLVDRILKGEPPGAIPFEQYKKLTLGINLDAAAQTGITIPREVLAQATLVVGAGAADASDKAKIGIVQFALEPNVEICKQGIMDALRESGFSDGERIEIIYKNAQADFSMIHSIIQDLIRREADIIVPLSTPCVQTAVQFARRHDKTKIVFTYIYDPFRIGAATSPEEHPPNMTGVACFPPIQSMLDLIREMVPERKKIGVVWNSSEANSEAVLVKARAYAATVGLEILEATVTSPADVLEASRSLVMKGAQVFLNGGDNTVNVSFDSFAKAAAENKIPVFSVDSEFLEKGSVAVLGPDYYRTGYEGGQYIARVLKGESPAALPILQTRATLFMLNLDAARACGIPVSEELTKKARKIIDSEKPSQSEASNPGKRLALFVFSDNKLLAETSKGILEELEESGILKQNNVSIDLKNAQNEFTLAQAIAQDIVRQRYDYIITVSTPSLQVMANTNKKIPHVFGAVTDPYRMGVAASSTDHLPNLTGVATFQPVGTTLKLMRDIFPDAKKIGVIWNPAEACSEACTYKAREAAGNYGFELLEANVSSTGEVLDALKSLLKKQPDLFLTSGDNTVVLAVESIAEILRQKRIPYFTNAPADIDRGVFLALGADYVEVGRATAKIAERVIRGEVPRNIPINDYVPIELAVNLALAGEYGVNIPPEVLIWAARVKE